MSKLDWSEFAPETVAIRSGRTRTPEGEHSEPIFTTSSFVFETAAQAAARFSGEEPGNIYSRFTNPTVRAFERRLAALEGGERCVAFASGMAAINAVMMGLLKAGDHIISSRNVFGTTTVLYQKFLAKFEVSVSFVDLTDFSSWERELQPETRLLYLETPSNPLGEVADIHLLAELAHGKQSLLFVDNVYCTPALQQPLSLGADLVVHSATKYIDGQGRCIGGAVIGSEEIMEQQIFPYLRAAGPAMSPFNAWVFLAGMETLSVRMRAHCENALGLAEWLQQQPGISRVYYSGLESHPQYELVKRQQKAAGGVVSFDVEGGREAAWRLIDSTRLLSITANLGDVKSTITHPATTTHGRLTPDERRAAGIGEGLVRVALGLENLDDIKNDLRRGLG